MIPKVGRGMAKTVVLFNPKAAGGKAAENAKNIATFYEAGEIDYVDVLTIDNYNEFFQKLMSDDRIVICGGDGTLNRFVNDTKECSYSNPVFYYASGTGNDFLNDINGKRGEAPIEITNYIQHLPIVTVKGKEYRFLNDVGFGIDGYCTWEGDRQREAGKKKINYTLIALKGMFGKFHPLDASVTVDGKTETFHKVWLAPTMKGRYFGGGMMPTPAQDRNDPQETLSCMVFWGKGKLKTVITFPQIFKGTHVKYTDMVRVFRGQEFHVKFNRPCALQIDGETIADVTEYYARTEAFEKQKKNV